MGSSLTLSTGFSWLKIKNNLEQLFKSDVVVECRESWCQIAKSLASFFWSPTELCCCTRTLLEFWWLGLIWKKKGEFKNCIARTPNSAQCAVFTHMIVVAHARCCWANMLNGSFYTALCSALQPRSCRLALLWQKDASCMYQQAKPVDWTTVGVKQL